jgi:hypothetical protein
MSNRLLCCISYACMSRTTFKSQIVRLLAIQSSLGLVLNITYNAHGTVFLIFSGPLPVAVPVQAKIHSECISKSIRYNGNYTPAT